MSHITVSPLRRPQQFFGQDCMPVRLAESAIEHKRLADENEILRQRLREAIAGQTEIALRLAEAMERESALVAAVAQHEAIDKLRLAQLARADALQTTQRLRIDELSKLNTEYCSEIERLEEVVAKLRIELAAVLGPGGMEILRGECDA